MSIFRLSSLGLLLLLLAAPAAIAQRGNQELISKHNEALEHSARAIAEAINNREVAAFLELMDIRAFALRVAKFNADDDTSQKQFAESYLKRKQEFAETIFRNLSNTNAQAKFMRIVSNNGEPRALIRFNMGDMGYEYWELDLRRQRDGGYKLVDWYQLSSGQLFSTNVGALTNLMIKPNRNIFETLFGAKKYDQTLSKTLITISNALKTRDTKSAIEAFESLPDDIKFTRVMCTVGINIANLTQDDDLYLSMLARLNKYHADDPSAAFALLDYHLYQQRYDEAIKSIAAIEKRVGRDAFVILLYANVNLLRENFQQSAHLANQAVETEADFEDAYHTLSLSYVKLNQFENAVQVFELLRQNFGYEYSREDFEREENFSDFVKSKAFHEWMN